MRQVEWKSVKPSPFILWDGESRQEVCFDDYDKAYEIYEAMEGIKRLDVLRPCPKCGKQCYSEDGEDGDEYAMMCDKCRDE